MEDGSRREGISGGKKGANAKDKASTSAIKDGKMIDRELFHTTKAVNGETQASVVSKNEEKSKEKETARGKTEVTGRGRVP